MRRMVSVLTVLAIVLCLSGCNKTVDSSSESSASEIASSGISSSFVESSSSPKGITPTVTSVPLQNTIAGADTRDTFVYKSSYIAILHQSGEIYALSFFDVNLKKLCAQRYDVIPMGEYVFSFDHGDAYYIVFEGVTYAVTGSPVDDFDISPVEDYTYSLERDDTVLWSRDRKWYAFMSRNNVKLCNTETGKTVVPYKGITSEEDQEIETASRFGGFVGDYFVYNIVGYEWGYGYGVYNLVTGKNQSFDGLYDVNVNPFNSGTDKVSYEVFNEEVGYIRLDKPDEMVVIYNEGDNNELTERMGYSFSGFYAANGRYYCVLADCEGPEGSDRGIEKFTVLSAEDGYISCFEYDELDTFTYYVCGSSVVFVKETIDENTYTVITLA